MRDFLSQNRYILYFSLFFVAVSLALIINSGYITCDLASCQLTFSEWQMHDALWHISLAKLAFNSYPFSNPFYAGSTLAGYNYFLDLVLFGLTKLGIPALQGYFVVMPLSAVGLYLYTSWVYLKEFCTTKFERYLASFFLYAGTSLSYLATLYADSSLSGATLRGFPVVTSLHPPSMLLNLPYALSLPLLLITLVWLKTRSPKLGGLTLATFVFLAFGLKFYAGVTLVLLMLLIPARPLQYFARGLSLSLGAALAYFLFYRGSTLGFPFAYAPLSLPHVVVDDILLFYNHSLTLARYYLYENQSGLPLRLIAIELSTVLAFLALNWGTRILCLCALPPRRTISSLVWRLLFLGLALGTIPIFFVQKGGWYNTMQFMYYSSFLLSLASANLLGNLHRVKPRRAVVFALLIALPLLPTTLEQFSYYFRDKLEITKEEFAGLRALQAEPPGIVHVNRPWAKRALIPAFAEKEMYYLDSDQLMLMLPSHVERLALVKKYEGGSIHQIPADYYVVYKNEVASDDSLKTLNRLPGLRVLYDSPILSIFALTRSDDTIK